MFVLEINKITHNEYMCKGMPSRFDISLYTQNNYLYDLVFYQ